MSSSVSQTFARFQPFRLDLNVPIYVSARMVPQLPESFSKNTLFWTCYKFLANFSLHSASALPWERGREQESSVLTAPAPCSSAPCSVPMQGCCKVQSCSMPACTPDGGHMIKSRLSFQCTLCSCHWFAQSSMNCMAKEVTKPSFSGHNRSLCCQTFPSPS